jgi:rhamnose transport system permease protein
MSQIELGNETARYVVLERAPFQLRNILLRWEVILVIMLIAVITINTIISPFFLDVFNLSDATQQFSEKAMIALPMALLILVREIDLSVAAIIALAAMAIGYAANAGAGPVTLFAVGILVGVACGAFNGALVTLAGLPSIVVTIGTLSLFRGITQVILGDQALTKYPPEFTTLGQSYLVKMAESGVPYVALPPLYLSFMLFLGLAVIFGLVLHKTVTGRRLFAMGANPVAARFSGIPVDRIRFMLFMLSGALSGLAAALLTARLGSVRPNIGIGWELDIITVVILGGVSIAGGIGSILGVVLAVFVLGLVTFGLSLNNVQGPVVNVLMGTLLVLSLATPIVARMFLNRRH